ncbi:MAG: hypothetical protein Sv326_1198 [Candidatus Fermentimicrarchaeum limneticum]|uniref:Uncharacterized protein n=1 Tax=Fermentimicrarchaeum limneticum TaxID=2795018 RepID=A0A7D5XFS5_FERL1|nr:MAG: hypothetical protein Sv326_1198 [Candidatus Fermentimicrarchaeum limneticum]
MLLKRVRIPLVNIRKKYFVYLILVFFVSLILHEFGHIAVVLAGGGRITSFTLTRLTWEAQPSGDLPYLLGGPLVTLIICYFAVYKFFDDRKNPDLWLATVVCNLSPPISLMLYLLSLPHDEGKIMSLANIPPIIFLPIYFLIFSLPILVAFKAPKLPINKKITFYLYNLVILLAELKFLSILGFS